MRQVEIAIRAQMCTTSGVIAALLQSAQTAQMARSICSLADAQAFMITATTATQLPVLVVQMELLQSMVVIVSQTLECRAVLLVQVRRATLVKMVLLTQRVLALALELTRIAVLAIIQAALHALTVLLTF